MIYYRCVDMIYELSPLTWQKQKGMTDYLHRSGCLNHDKPKLEADSKQADV